MQKFVFAFLVVIWSLQPGIAQAASLSADQIKAQIIGKKWKWASGGVNGTIRYKRNGSIFVTISTAIKQDTGTWRFKGNRLCTSYKKIRSGKEACVTYTKKGSQFVASNGGVLSR